VLALLPTGKCRLYEVAELIELSPRVLQKRLHKQGLRFSQILTQARLEMAKQHLQYSDINLTELTLNLGFEEPAVFSRAFKLWTGSSPRQWRQANQSQ
jgi:AraC-like DNA-binding protein